MIALDRLAAESGITVAEIEIWVERRWILPGRGETQWIFTEADRARILMIAEFRRDLAIDDEAMPVVLDLVDRLHAARARLRAVLEAVRDLPDAHRDRVLQKLSALDTE